MNTKSKNCTILCIVVLFMVFTFFVYAPLELYLTNINEFSFTLSDFWFVIVLAGALAFSVLFIFGLVLPLKVQNLYISVLCTFSLMMYIQSNFLNIDVGVLNGGSVDWALYRMSFLKNFVLWVLVISGGMCIYTHKIRIMKKVMSYVSVCLTLIQGVTLIVLLLTGQTDVSTDSTEWYLSSKDIYEVSEEENVIVFLMDMFDDRYFKELLELEPELAEKFDGFTEYANSTGNYSTTSYSIATLMTGQYFTNSEDSLKEEVDVLYENCETFDILKENGYRLDIYTYEASVPSKLMNSTNNYIQGSNKIASYLKLAEYFYRGAASRYMPDFMKQYVWLIGTEFDFLSVRCGEADAHSVDNVEFYENMLSEGITVQDKEKCFKFIHLDAVHYPYTMNENVERVEENSVSAQSCARGVLKILLEYMNEMKDAKVYDNSSIIIMADHGYYWDGVLTNPVLLVKPKNATGTLKVSDAPVSQHDFHASILTLAGLNEDGRYGLSYADLEENDEDRERLFYQYYLGEGAVNRKYRLIEYTIDSEGNERKNFHLTGVEYTVDGEKINHFAHCEYCKSGLEKLEANDPEERIVHE